MLRFLKRPEVVYCLVVAAVSVVLFPLTGLLGAYYLFFFIFSVLLLAGKANYVLRLEMLDGTVTRHTDWSDPQWGPDGPLPR